MTIVSVLNYKGGVGKTTVAANLAAEIAFRGRRVLLVDMDPQASLTLSFYAADELAKEFSDSGTLLHWFESILRRPGPAAAAASTWSRRRGSTTILRPTAAGST